MIRRRVGSLGARLAIAMVALVLLTAAVTAVSGYVLFRRADEAAARRGLGMLADSVAAQVNAGADAAQAAATIGTPSVRVAVLSGLHVTGEPLAKQATRSEVVDALRSGQSVSERVTIGGTFVFVEARPTKSGGVILAQRRVDASALLEQIVTQWLWLVAGVGVLAAGMGLLLAWRVASPIRQLVVATKALAEGDRRPVHVSGPTEVRALAEEITLLSADLARSEARQREFLLSVSHDLRTPLATIAGYAESLADGAIPHPEVRAVGAVVSDETARLGRMVSDLLDLARAASGELTFRPTLVDLRDVVRSATAAWAERCAAKHLSLLAEVAEIPVGAHVDPQRLRQAIDGLLDNAVRVTPSGRPIVVACRADGQGAVVAVRDGGPGLSDDDVAVAFDRGALHERYRGRREVGTGVGLALVDRLVRRQGGTVTAGHAPEGGAAFTIWLPSAREPSEGAAR